MNDILEIFSYDFMVKAFLVGILVTISAALVGAPLVLKQKAMLGDGLSHVGFLAFAAATVLGLAPTPFAIPLVIFVSFLILRLNENSKINGDAAIALISASALAIGVILISVNGVNVDINSYLFGSILATGTGDLAVAAVMAVLTAVLFFVFYNRIFAVTFDEKFARSIGVKTGFYNALFAILCSVVVVVGMKLAGALLISSLLIFPTLTAGQVAKSFRGVVLTGTLVSLLNFLIGFFVAYGFDLPIGATIVVINLLTFMIFKAISLIKCYN